MVKNYITIFLFLTSFIFSRNIQFHSLPLNTYKNVPANQFRIGDNFKEKNLPRSLIDTTVIWSEGFESNTENWLRGLKGWLISDTDSSPNSSSHSIWSPNDEATKALTEGAYEMYTVFSPMIDLPDKTLNNELYFNFYINNDMVGLDSEKILHDYYEMDIQYSLDISFWHISNYEAYSGNSYWCGLDEIEGYNNNWVQFLDTPHTETISIPSDGAEMSVQMKWSIEDNISLEEVLGGFIDGWDAANVRISIDGGITWEILIGDDPYDFYSGYGWVNNGEKAGEDGLYSLASGWSGEANWHEVKFNLNSYAGEDVIIRFAFGSDPAYSKTDNCTDSQPCNDVKGLFVDDINITTSSGDILFNQDFENEENNFMVSSSLNWFFQNYYETCMTEGYFPEDGLYNSLEDYCILTHQFWNYKLLICFTDLNENGVWDESEPEISVSNEGSCETIGGVIIKSPGSDGWETFWEFNPDKQDYGWDFLQVFQELESEIRFRFSTIYNDIYTSSEGKGLFIDDLSIYTVNMLSDSSYVNSLIYSYAQPELFSADLIDGKVHLSWHDMNMSGDSLFIFDNQDSTNFLGVVSSISGNAGTLFPTWMGASTIESISVYNGSGIVTNGKVKGYGIMGDSPNIYEPIYSEQITFENEGWNEVLLSGWEFPSLFIIAQEFSNIDTMFIDLTADEVSAWILNENDVNWYDYFSGSWCIRAQVNYEGIDVTYNIYKNGILLASGLTNGIFVDEDVEYYTENTYILNIVFPNGSVTSDTLKATPVSSSAYQVPAYDDGSFESILSLSTDEYSAVRFQTGQDVIEEIVNFKWYQDESGGYFTLLIWEDDNGAPGNIIWSDLLNSQDYPKVSGWNSASLSNEHITVSGDFWIGIEGKMDTKSVGLDETSNSNNSFTRTGEAGEWIQVEGNLSYRITLDSNPLSTAHSIIPSEFGIDEIYPNPFNPIANIQFEISKLTDATLSIYDLNGRLVKMLIDDMLNPGYYTAVWNGTEGSGYQVSSGIYFVALKVEGGKIQTRKLVFLK